MHDVFSLLVRALVYTAFRTLTTTAMVATVWYIAGGLLLLVVYIKTNDAKLRRISPEAAAFAPNRWKEEDVGRTSEQLSASPASLLDDKLPPKTGRRYIITGGVSPVLISPCDRSELLG